MVSINLQPIVSKENSDFHMKMHATIIKILGPSHFDDADDVLQIALIKLWKSAGSSGDGTNGISGNSIESASIDLGFLASLRQKYRFGVFIENINSSSLGNGITSQNLPRKNIFNRSRL